MKYADCTTAFITASISNNNLIIAINDDGRGFELSQISENEKLANGRTLGGNGIKNMRARAEDMIANLHIHSKLNEGTTVQLTMGL